MDRPPPQINGVIFDLDGTLSDTWPPALVAFRAAVEDFAHRSYSDEELKSYAGPSEDGIMQELVPDVWEQCFDAYVAGFAEQLVPGKIVFPGVAVILERLRSKGLRMAIVSGKAKPAVDVACEMGGITQFFDPIIGGRVTGDHKAEDLMDIAALWDCDPKALAYVGDTKGDIAAAREVGAMALGAAWADYTDTDDLALAKPDVLFATTEEFDIWVSELKH